MHTRRQATFEKTTDFEKSERGHFWNLFTTFGGIFRSQKFIIIFFKYIDKIFRLGVKDVAVGLRFVRPHRPGRAQVGGDPVHFGGCLTFTDFVGIENKGVSIDKKQRACCYCRFL